MAGLKEQALTQLKSLITAAATAPLSDLEGVWVQSIDHADISAAVYPFCLLSYGEGIDNRYRKLSLKGTYQHTWIARVFFATGSGETGWPSPLFSQAQADAQDYPIALLTLLEGDTTKWNGTILAYGDESRLMQDNFTYWEWNGLSLLGMMVEIPVTQVFN